MAYQKDKKKKKKKKKRQEITIIGEGVEKRGPLCTAGGNVNWCSHYGEQYRGFSKKSKIELSYDLAIPLLGIYLKETKTLTQKYGITIKNKEILPFAMT